MTEKKPTSQVKPLPLDATNIIQLLKLMFGGLRKENPALLTTFVKDHRFPYDITLNVLNTESQPIDHQMIEEHIQRILGKDFPFKNVANDCWTLPIAALERVIPETNHPAYVEACRRKKIQDEVIDLIKANPEENYYSFYVAKLLGADVKQGPYFPLEKLRNLINDYPDDLYFPTKIVSDRAIYSGYVPYLERVANKNPATLEKLIQRLDEMGIRRIAYVGSGRDSVAFKTIPDGQGRQQILMFCDPETQHSGHPALLPAIHEELISEDDGHIPVKLRIMPEVTFSMDSYVVDKIRHDLRKSGATHGDINKTNVGIYLYTDAQKVKHDVPFVIDWEEAHPLENADVESWKTNPDFAAQWAAAEYITNRAQAEKKRQEEAGYEHPTGMEGTLPRDRLEAQAKESPNSLTLKAANEKGRYGSEIGGAIERATARVDLEDEQREQCAKDNPDVDLPDEKSWTERFQGHLRNQLDHDASSLGPAPSRY